MRPDLLVLVVVLVLIFRRAIAKTLLLVLVAGFVGVGYLLIALTGCRRPPDPDDPVPPVAAGDVRVPGGNRRFDGRRVLPFRSTPNTPAEQRKSS